MSGPALVLFALEGVLVDSAAIRARCWSKTLAEHGVTIAREPFRERFQGRSDAAVIRSLEAERGAPLAPGLIEAYEARARTAFERELRPVPDVRGTVKRLALPVCALSGYSFGLARHALEVTGLWPFFAANLFTTSTVAQEPPAADLAHCAAAQMGVRVARCLLIEASVDGVRGGRAAGMIVYGFAGAPETGSERQGEQLLAAGARLVFDRMSELAPLVRSNAA